MQPYQLVTPDGDLRPDADDSDDPVDGGTCLRLYRDMVLARRLDQEGYHLQRQGELGLWLQCLGQEAAQVGSIRAIRDDDWVFPSYRDHAAALCRGITPAELLAQWRGVSHSGWSPSRYRFHIYTLVLAAQLPHAVGYAMGVQRDGTDEIVLTYFGDGSSSEGEANEAFNWAATMHSPVLFFCQNNQWAISTPTRNQFGAPLHQRAAGFGLASHLVDGNDVLAVHAVTSRAARAVRGGEGPALIEALTYRIAGHSTSDDPTRYRSNSEVDHWRALDPVRRIRLLLEKQGWAAPADFASIDEEGEDLAAETRRACLSMPEPEIGDLFAHVTATESAALAAERTAYTDYTASFVD